MSGVVYTIGHSTHATEEFIALLRRHEIAVLADVRSSPFSRFNPQFNREPLAAALATARVGYLFLGDELGARSRDPACYVDGRVSYDLVARTAAFARGLDAVMRAAQDGRVALMCAEKDPLACHRAILVSRHLAARGLSVHHILADGALEAHEESLRRLRVELDLPERDLFRGPDEMIAEAYRQRGAEIAYAAAAPEGDAEPSGAFR